MSNVAHSPQCVEVSDEALTDARKLRDLLAGAASMRSPDLVRGTIMEAHAVAQTLIDRLERFFMLEAERARNTHAAQLGKHVAPAVSR